MARATAVSPAKNEERTKRHGVRRNRRGDGGVDAFDPADPVDTSSGASGADFQIRNDASVYAAIAAGEPFKLGTYRTAVKLFVRRVRNSRTVHAGFGCVLVAAYATLCRIGEVMGARDSFHEYANRIDAICAEFARAVGCGASVAELQKISKPASELLNTLALSVRNDQDYGRTERPTQQVGSLLQGADYLDPTPFRTVYVPPFSSIPNSNALSLREALNKIAHSDRRDASFYVDSNHHEVIICGTDMQRRPWLAVISLPTMMSVIRSLPDKLIPNAA